MFSSKLNSKRVDLHSPGTPASRDLTSPLSAALYVENRELITNSVRALCQVFPRVSTLGHGTKSKLSGDMLRNLDLLVETFKLEDEPGRDGASSLSFKVLYNASHSTGTDQELRELRVFSDTLQDGYILCEYLNRLRSKRLTTPVKPDQRVISLAAALDVCLDNIQQFLSACITLGVPEEELFETRDLAIANNDSLARVAATIIAVSKHRKSQRRQSSTEMDLKSGCFVPVLRQESLHRQANRLQLTHEPHQSRSLDDTKPVTSGRVPSVPHVESSPLQVMMTLLSMIFRDKNMYRRFLEFRGRLAQIAIDGIQRIIGSGLLDKGYRTTFVTALLRLSLKSSLYPSCLLLRDVEREPFPCASGSFGDVYKGSCQGGTVCIKMARVYRKSQIDHALKLSAKAFSREALLWSQTNHPNVLPFYGVYQLDEAYRRVCLVSPWMEHGNIREYLVANPRACRVSLTRDVLRGLRYLHDRSIVHGDLKGPNILITLSGHACLSDFGLSCISDPHILQWTSIDSSVSAGGTVRWKAPELIDPEKDGVPTKESDIYAFGCVCYEIFTSSVPFYEITHDYSVIVCIMQGKKPTKPREDSDAVIKWGLTETVWSTMEDCWILKPRQRPTAKSVGQKFPRSPTHNRIKEARSMSESIRLDNFRSLAGEDNESDFSGELIDMLTRICASYSLSDAK